MTLITSSFCSAKSCSVAQQVVTNVSEKYSAECSSKMSVPRLQSFVTQKTTIRNFITVFIIFYIGFKRLDAHTETDKVHVIRQQHAYIMSARNTVKLSLLHPRQHKMCLRGSVHVSYMISTLNLSKHT